MTNYLTQIVSICGHSHSIYDLWLIPDQFMVITASSLPLRRICNPTLLNIRISNLQNTKKYL